MNDDIKTSINLGPEDPFNRHHIPDIQEDINNNDKNKKLAIIFYCCTHLKGLLPSHITIQVLEPIKKEIKNIQLIFRRTERNRCKSRHGFFTRSFKKLE